MTKAKETKTDEKPPVPMDLLQAALESGKQTDTLVLQIGGHDVPIRYRPLTWLEKSEVLSLALEYTTAEGDQKGATELTARLRHDIFRREALKRMIIESPIPITSDAVMDKLPSEIGDQLEAIIPSPFTSAQAEAVKKG